MTPQEIMTAAIWTPRLVFNSNLLFKKPYTELNDEQKLQVRARALGVKVETEDEYIDRLAAERNNFEHTTLLILK
jgi:hypothetical protein